MTSLLDQYEQNSQRTVGPTAPPTPAGPEVKSASGFINMAIEDETPMFCKQKVNFAPPDRIMHMCVSSELIVLAMNNGILFRIDLKQPEKHEEIEFSKLNPQLKLSGMFLDPTGDHLLMSFVPRNTDSQLQAELFYLNRKSNKIRPTSKFRGHEITAVGWNYNNVRSDTTRPLLLGTSKGLILETELSNDSERIFQSSLEQYWKQLPNYLPLYGPKDAEGMERHTVWPVVQDWLRRTMSLFMMLFKMSDCCACCPSPPKRRPRVFKSKSYFTVRLRSLCWDVSVACNGLLGTTLEDVIQVLLFLSGI
ncbi:Vacuolar protein sorting-associated protein 18 like protein [Homalodisca vitripennis]|nr:Vacuolar protein sorting-associated protein 18 like protein [Homalodisca vitripennis]